MEEGFIIKSVNLNFFSWTHRVQEAGIRYPGKQAPLWMYMNLKDGKCWCGKPKELFDKYQRLYCTSKHSAWWFYHIVAYWGSFRQMIFKQAKGKCEQCHKQLQDKDYGPYGKAPWEIDHIKALCLGGECYDRENVRLLCSKCHSKKTTDDRRKLRMKQKKLQPMENFLEH